MAPNRTSNPTAHNQQIADRDDEREHTFTNDVQRAARERGENIDLLARARLVLEDILPLLTKLQTG